MKGCIEFFEGPNLKNKKKSIGVEIENIF